MVQLQFIGNLGKDAEVKTTNNGKTVINFNAAYTTGYGDNKVTTWVSCAKWGEKTGIAEYLKKGVKVFVSGEPVLQTYTKQDGTTATQLALNVRDIELLTKGEAAPANAQAATATDDVASDLPF